jgi:hypothetical protein
MAEFAETRMEDSSETEQFFASFRRSEYLQPETALIAAILEDAIHDYRKYRGARDNAGKERFREAEEWLMHDGNEWIFSFGNVCEFLGLDPEYVRRGLHGMEGSQLEKPQGRDSRKRAA